MSFRFQGGSESINPCKTGPGNVGMRLHLSPPHLGSILQLAGSANTASCSCPQQGVSTPQRAPGFRYERWTRLQMRKGIYSEHFSSWQGEGKVPHGELQRRKPFPGGSISRFVTLGLMHIRASPSMVFQIARPNLESLFRCHLVWN